MATDEVKNFKDIQNLLQKQFLEINRNNLEQEKNRHKLFLEKHSEKSEKISERHSAVVTQLITLEGAIFTAVIVFGKPDESTTWLIMSICFILVSIFFGVWSQSLSSQSEFLSHQWEYVQELRNHWWTRELWKDSTVKTEREVIEPNLLKREDIYKKTVTYKILGFLHLNNEKIENIFKITFLVSLLLLILHFTSIPI